MCKVNERMCVCVCGGRADGEKRSRARRTTSKLSHHSLSFAPARSTSCGGEERDKGRGEGGRHIHNSTCMMSN